MKKPPVVFAIGSKVKIDGDLTAVVLGVTMRSSGVSYEVVWWEERSRRSEWLYDFEVSAVKGSKTMEVGFK